MAAYQLTLKIERLPEGPFLGTSPDLPGLIVQADTAEEVIRFAPAIARDLVEVMQETGQAPGNGTKLSTQRNREFSRTLRAQTGEYKLPVSSGDWFSLSF